MGEERGQGDQESFSTNLKVKRKEAVGKVKFKKQRFFPEKMRKTGPEATQKTSTNNK